TTFKFFDQEIHPNDHQKQIEHATHFQHLTQIITTSNLSSLLTPMYLNSIGMKGHQKKLSQPRVRRKRQAHREEKIVIHTTQSSTHTKKNSKQINQTFFHDRKHASQASRIEEENRILAIADDYLKKYDSSLRKKSYRNTKKLNQKKNKNKRKDVGRRKRQTKIKNSTVKNWNKVVSGDFFQTLPKLQSPPLANSSALLPSFRDHFSHSGSDFLASAANDTEIHSQSLFLSWIYHTLWGKKAKPLNFRETIEMEHENQIYRAIDKFEKLQNKSSYSWS
ncbi:MAG: hypothetical protein PHH73_06265, partial [Candidatus Rickettsiella isopodorum]|nr:hypothetical protein [Candidatus Rickettsiella isopodorum]MDD5162517.1 hypothetical protein [Candidatus Rickettsiella isopodorum]